MKQSWWHNATTEQRLAQIDGGIECGMSGRQIALATGLGPDKRMSVVKAALQHGRNLGASGLGNARVQEGRRRRHNLDRNRRAYLHGERVDFFGTAGGDDGFRLDETEV